MKDFLKLPGPARDYFTQTFRRLLQDADYFCMAKPTIYDVVYQGRKIAGAAQRRRKNGYLHQGTISLAFPQMGLLNEVLFPKRCDSSDDGLFFCSIGPLLGCICLAIDARGNSKTPG